MNTTDAYGIPTMDDIKKDGPEDKPWTLYNKEGTKVLGRHASKAGAIQQRELEERIVINASSEHDADHGEELKKKKNEDLHTNRKKEGTSGGKSMYPEGAV